MKNNLKVVLIAMGLVSVLSTYAQPNTEVYLMEVERIGDSLVLSDPLNISLNEGYDNQPSFYNSETILFSSTRNGQTDIKEYHIPSGKSKWLTNTAVGSEYSPTRIPGTEAVSAIRLDTTGLQRLYRYDLKEGTSQTILKDAKVGYHLWYSPEILVATELVENRMDLTVNHLGNGDSYTYQKSVGRNLLRIPGSDAISYVSKSSGTNTVKSMNVTSGATDSITLAPTIEDFAWTPDGLLLAGYQNNILSMRPGKSNWSVAHSFSDKNLSKITRIVLSPSGDKLVLVSEISPEGIVQKQVDSYNDRDLDAFVGCYDENVWVGRFPKDTLYVGRETMRSNYANYFKEVASTGVKVTSRIVIGNKVIDQELAEDNGKEQYQVAIYEVVNNRIASMNFIFDKPTEDPEAIVQKQLDAYNARDIDAFLATYTDDVALYNYPNTLRSEGQDAMREGYTGFFENTPDLHCEIINRIVIGNKVIDEEYITANGGNFSAVAVYEVENGKIAKVTFIQ